MYTNSDCTIFHKYYDAETMQNDKISVFYITNCFWSDARRINRISTGVESSDSAMIVINDISNQIKPKAWETLEDKGDYWTIGSQDKIVKGNIPSDTPFKDLEDLYDDVLNVISVDYNMYGSQDMWNIEVGAK